VSARGARPERGFTLLEVLIAIVVFSIGLLGIAGLQVAGMRYTHGSQLRSVATMQAENMADAMRANRVGVADGHYNVTGAMPAAADKDCSAESCTPAELAEFDLATWNSAADDGKPHESNGDVLPGGEGIVCIDSTPNDGDAADWACDDTGTVYAVKLVWQERTMGDWEQAEDGGGGDADSEDLQQQFLFLRVVP
jgi:type IV pilus assembly protein PilV